MIGRPANISEEQKCDIRTEKGTRSHRQNLSNAKLEMWKSDTEIDAKQCLK